MRSYATLLVLLRFSSLVAAWNHVRPDEFETTIQDNEVVLVTFVSKQYDARTKSLADEWDAALAEAPGVMISVACRLDPGPCKKYGISQFPTTRLFRNGSPVTEYLGPQSAPAITNFLRRLSRPVLSHISASYLPKFKTSDEVVFVAYLSPPSDDSDGGDGYVAPSQSRHFAALQQLATRFRDEFTFGYTTDPAAAAAEELTAPAIVCYRPADGDTETFNKGNGWWRSDGEGGEVEGKGEGGAQSGEGDGGKRLEELVEWAEEASRPLIAELSEWNRERFIKRQWPMVYLFHRTARERAHLRHALLRFAREQRDLSSVVVDPVLYGDLQTRTLGLDPAHLPAGAVHQLTKDRVWRYPKRLAVTAQALQQWGLDVFLGKLKPWVPPERRGKEGEREPSELDLLAGGAVKIKGTQRLELNLPGREKVEVEHAMPNVEIRNAFGFDVNVGDGSEREKWRREAEPDAGRGNEPSGGGGKAGAPTAEANEHKHDEL